MNHSPKFFQPARAPHFRRFLPVDGGFSLVEVVMALGIASFAMISIIGLLSVGMNVFRDAANTSAQTSIAQSLTSTARQTDFSQLTSLNGSYYFDEEGIPVDSQSRISSEDYLYTATVTVISPSVVPRPVLSGSTARLATVSIDIHSRSRPDDTAVVSTFVADNGS